MLALRPIRTAADYDWALKEVAGYFDAQPAPGTPDGDRFDVLATLVEAYEAATMPIAETDPVDALHFAIQSMGRSQADLARILGSRSRASEILNRRRLLTLQMIRAISEEWRLPAATLISPYAIRRELA